VEEPETEASQPPPEEQRKRPLEPDPFETPPQEEFTEEELLDDE